jgi:dienelactone hydrolase
VTRHLVRLTLGGNDTVVEVARPDAPGQFPAIVFAHGAGTGNHTAFTEHSEVLARAGIVCLVPDKHLAQYTALHRNYEAMAQQYLDLARWARGREWADPARVGYWGESEGAWIVPMSVAMDAAGSFLVLVSAPVVTPRQHGLFSACVYLRDTGAPPGVLHAVPRFTGSPMPGGRVDYADFAVEPYLRQVTCPVLMVYGTQDHSVPTIQGPLTVMEQLTAAGNRQVTVRYYPANHGLRAGEDQRVNATFLDDVGAWVGGLPRTANPAPGTTVAGEIPHQPFWVTAAPPVNWFGRISTQGWMGAASVAAVGMGPVIWAARRAVGRPRRPLRPELRWPFAVFTSGSVVTVASFAAYLARVIHLAVNYRHEPLSVVWGYRGVQAAAAGSVAGGALLALRTWDLAAAGQPLTSSRGQWWRLVMGSAGALGLLAFGSYWGLFPFEPRDRDA